MSALWWFPWLAGCGPDLAKLETEEEALSREVATLRGDVAEMRVRMEEQGLLPAGPEVSGAALPTAESDLDEDLRVTITRTGTPPAFPSLGSPERRAKTACGYRFDVGWLENLSDVVLDESGSGKSSPVLLTLGGVALEPHANPATFEKACRFSFKHAKSFLMFSPKDDVDNVAGSWALGLTADLPMKRGGDGREVYWVYPGTSVTVAFESGWDAEQWGTPTVTLDARNFYVGTPEVAAAQIGAPATVTFLGRDISSTDPQWGAEEVIEPPDGAWSIEIASPSDGPYVLLETLVVGNAEHARVVTSEAGG